MNMSELIAKHNELAEMLGVSQETSFKSLAAAREAVANLEKKMEDASNPSTGPEDTETTGTIVHTTEEKSKYSSTGKRGPTQGVGAYAKQCIVDGMDNKTALAATLSKFPSAKTTMGCIAFYRTALSKGPVAADPDALRAKAQAMLDQAAALDAARAEAAQALAAAAAPLEATV